MAFQINPLPNRDCDLFTCFYLVINSPPIICLSLNLGPIVVTRTVQQYARSGVAGFHIEDQVQTKRCGHLQGKQLVDTPTFISRIRAAKAARDNIDSDIVIIARTDALQSLGYKEAIRRLKAA
jgi:2-methylisocitrate lyase-like PEP mutase family enzyme